MLVLPRTSTTDGPTGFVSRACIHAVHGLQAPVPRRTGSRRAGRSRPQVALGRGAHAPGQEPAAEGGPRRWRGLVHWASHASCFEARIICLCHSRIFDTCICVSYFLHGMAKAPRFGLHRCDVLRDETCASAVQLMDRSVCKYILYSMHELNHDCTVQDIDVFDCFCGWGGIFLYARRLLIYMARTYACTHAYIHVHATHARTHGIPGSVLRDEQAQAAQHSDNVAQPNLLYCARYDMYMRVHALDIAVLVQPEERLLPLSSVHAPDEAGRCHMQRATVLKLGLDVVGYDPPNTIEPDG